MSAPSEFDVLVQRYLDGEITADEMARLNARMESNAEERRKFSELLNLDSALAATAAGWEPQATSIQKTPSAEHKVVRFPIMSRWLAAAAGIVLAAFAGWWLVARQPYATVASGMVSGTLSEGATLRGGTYELKSGTVEMITARGARVVVEAPAAFQFESAQRLRLMHGRVAADVPPTAKGFTVITPTGKAVDLGTKFGVDVPLQGEAEVHVFQGEVIAQSSGGGKPQNLRGGEAFSLQSGAGSARELRSAAFIRPDEIASLQAGLAAGQRARAQAALVQLRSDPALIALLDFSSPQLPEGTYRLVQGRWPGSQAPEFVNVGDHMKIDVGGDREWPQLTLAAWVRLDRLGAPYQSLLHTDGWDANKPGQVHWMVTANSTMRLALFGNTMTANPDERGYYPDSHTPVLPEQGRWVHLAAVYDATRHTVRFYFNGEFDTEIHQEIAHPARLGPAQIGNWDRQDRKLSGRIDELLLLGRAMSDDEVRAQFAAGSPYR